MKKLTFIFFYTSKDKIVTSDNPSFMFTNEEGKIELTFVASPCLYIKLLKKDLNAPCLYPVYQMNAEEVHQCNVEIFRNASNMVLSDTTIDPKIYEH